MKGEAHDALEGKIDGAIEAPVEDARLEEDGVADASEVRRQIDALNDRHLRLAAEFDNYRKRTERERVDTWSRSQAELASRLLEVLDDLQRVAHVDPEGTSVDALLEGVQLVERKLQRAMSSAGLEEIEAEGQPFDPSTMEALMTVDAEDVEQDDVVAGVLQKGYRFRGHLLRPARVQVRKYNG